VRLAKCDAGQAVRDEARVDGVEAREQTGVPGFGALGRLLLDDIAGSLEHVVGARHPVLDVFVVDRARLGRSSSNGCLMRSHCVVEGNIKDCTKKRVPNSGYQKK